jgi:acid stress-induced BolA-like protein IbaG/YrbA
MQLAVPLAQDAVADSTPLSLGARAAGPCNIPPMNPEEVARLIRAGLPGAQVRVQSDDNTHFAARIVAREFAGKKSVARHQLVYRALGELMGREIHALSIEALTPEESAHR